MATLTTNVARDYQLGEREDYPVVAADIIYQGAAVGENGSGYARPLVAGDAFLGFAYEKADNADGSAGDVLVNVRPASRVVLDVVGADITSNDRVAVYASDDATFTTTSTANSLIGYVSHWISGTTCVVQADSGLVKAALQA